MDSSRPFSASPQHPGVVPLPVNFSLEPGHFDVGRIRRIQIETDVPGVREVAYFLARELSNRIGRFVKCGLAEENADYFGTIGLTTATKKVFLTQEGYDLDVKGPLAFVSAPDPRGLLHGAITLLQLIEEDREGGFVVPAVRAIDKPSVPWRAVRIDASRGEISAPALARMVEIAAILRCNGLRLARRADAVRDDAIEALSARCRELGIALLVESGEPRTAGRPFRIIRLTAPAAATAETTNLPAVELEISDSPIPTVEEIHACSPDAYALEEDHRCVGLEAWIDWVPGAPDALLERAYLTRLAAFSEVAWTGSFRRPFPDFRERLAGFFAALDRIGADYDVPPPVGVPELIEFESERAIELIPPLPGSRVEYTLDGTDPRDGSPIATAPLFLREEGELRARTRLPNGKASSVVVATIRRRDR